MGELLKLRDLWKVNDLVSYFETPDMGLGVRASTNIDRGVSILRDPVRTFSGKDASLIRQTSAYHLYFVDRGSYKCGTKNSPIHAAIGPISIINHDANPNSELRWCKIGKVDAYVELFSSREIYAGEELFISYHNIDEYEFS